MLCYTMEKRPFPEMILGQRVVLRKHLPEQAKIMYWAIHKDRERLSLFLPWVPLVRSIEDEEEYIRKTAEAWVRGEMFDYGIYKQNGGEFLGNIGVQAIHWRNNSCELGYWLTGSSEGRGYMSDSVRAIERVAFEMGFNRVVIRVNADNERSTAVPRRLGYRFEGTHFEDAIENNKYRDTMVFSKLKSQFNNVAPIPFRVAKTSDDPQLQILVEELVKQHGCHTVILYGNRSQGRESSASDFDLIGVRPTGDKVRVARVDGDSQMDLFVFSEKDLERPNESHLHLREGRVLLEKDDFGTRLLEKLKKLHALGPTPMPAGEIQARKLWARKMFEGVKSGDLEAHYNKSWLILALLEDYFVLRNQWYLGPKASIDWIEHNDSRLYTLLQQVLRNEVKVEDLKPVVEYVY